jgi:hypothetical protein
MKKIYLTIAFLISIVTLSKAQWTTSGTSIYNSNTGNVGIGTTAPITSLQINGGVVAGGNTINIDPASSYGTLPNNLANTGQVMLGWNRAAGAGETDLIANQGAGNTGGFAFYNHNNSNVETQLMWIRGDGSVGIGTAAPGTYKLAVNGSIHAKQVNIDVTGWPDYVFRPTYHLPSLNLVKSYIDQNHHLPEMPSEGDVAKDGLNLGEANKLLLKKVEELTLYMIDMDKQLKEQQQEIRKLKKHYKKK